MELKSVDSILEAIMIRWDDSVDDDFFVYIDQSCNIDLTQKWKLYLVCIFFMFYQFHFEKNIVSFLTC